MRINLNSSWAKELKHFLSSQLEKAKGINEIDSQVEAVLIADYLRDLGILSYAEGASLKEVADLFVRSSRYNLKVFHFHGTLVGKKESGLEQYVVDKSLTNSRRALYAMELALACGAIKLAQNLTPYVWDPENASYLGPDSVVCTPQDQHLAYALRDLLSGQNNKGIEEIETMNNITKKEGYHALLLLSLLTKNFFDFVEALGRHHNHYLSKVNQKTALDNLEDLLDITALAYIALGKMHFPGFVLPKPDPFMPSDLPLSFHEDNFI